MKSWRVSLQIDFTEGGVSDSAGDSSSESAVRDIEGRGNLSLMLARGFKLSRILGWVIEVFGEVLLFALGVGKNHAKELHSIPQVRRGLRSSDDRYNSAQVGKLPSRRCLVACWNK